ncbi:MAG TPA: phosphopantetheine-binding protein [Thermoanaerobaculia bacterium]
MADTNQRTADDVEKRVLEVIARAMDRPVSEVRPESSLEMDLGAESLDYLDIAFSLEREFRIQFPRADFMQRAGAHFGEENLVRDGVITDLGLRLLARGMPELDPTQLRTGLKVTEVRKMFSVATFIRVVKQLLEAKEKMDRTCPDCGAQMSESPSLPEFVCPSCGKSVPLPSGDDILFDHVVGVELAEAQARTQNEGGGASA